MVAAKFLTSRFLNREAVARTFRQIWRSSNGFKILHLGDHLAHFVPENSNDEDKIISNQLWSFDKHLVVLERYESDNPICELAFTQAAFWVQVHDIPIRYMTRNVAESICETIGEVSRSIGAVDDDGGHFIWVRVVVDISLPLCRERVITLESGEKAWISFSTSAYPIFVTVVVDQTVVVALITIIRTVICGSKVKVLLQGRNNNLVQTFVLCPINQQARV